MVVKTIKKNVGVKKKVAVEGTDFKLVPPIFLERRRTPETYALRNGNKPSKALIAEFACTGFGGEAKGVAEQLMKCIQAKTSQHKSQCIQWKSVQLKKVKEVKNGKKE